MEILNKKQKIILIIIITCVLIFIGYYIINKANNAEHIEFETLETSEIEKIEENNIEETKYIIVHITGEVKEPGIVKIEENSRIADVIKRAGGATTEADLTKINLAYIVQDGQKIYVPKVLEDSNIEYITESAGENVISEENNKVEKVNINTASQTELETLSGIGPSTALKIIEYREKNGKFKKIEEIKNIPGIGDSKYESIKDSIFVK